MTDTEPDLFKIKGNVSKMVRMGAPQNDIDDYIKGEGVTVDQVKAYQFKGFPTKEIAKQKQLESAQGLKKAQAEESPLNISTKALNMGMAKTGLPFSDVNMPFSPRNIAGESAKALGLMPGVNPFMSGALYLGGQGVEDNKSAGDITGQSLLGGVGTTALDLATKGAGKLLGGVGEFIGKGIPQSLKDSATKAYMDVLGATTKENKEIAKKVAPEMAKRGVVGLTRETLRSKAEQGMDEAWQKLDQETSDLSKRGAVVNTEPIVKELKGIRDSLRITGTKILPKINVALDRSLLDLTNDINKLARKNKYVPIESIRSLRQAVDKSVAKGGKIFGLTGRESVTREAEKIFANTIRKELANQFPDVAKLNTEFTFWLRMKDILDETIARKKPSSDAVKSWIGEASGHPTFGIILRNMTSIVTEPTILKTFLASKKSKFADYMSQKKFVQANNLLGNLLVKAGKNFEKLSPYSKALGPIVTRKTDEDQGQ